MSAPVSAVDVGLDDAEVAGDAGRGAGVVAGDHDDPHAGGVGLGDGRPRLRARRVDDADHPQVDELALDRLVLGRWLDVGQRPVGDRQRAQRQVGEPVDRRPAPRARRSSVSGRTSPATRSCVQRVEQHVGRALGDDRDPALPLDVGLERGHQLALGRERDLAHPLEPRARRASVSPILASATRNAASVGSPWIVHVAAVLAQHGVVGQAAAAAARRAPRRAAPGRRAGGRRPAARPPAGSRSR